MDGHDEAGLLIEGIVMILDLDEGGKHARLPVMDVDDVWLEVNEREGVSCGKREEGEAFAIIAIAIKAIAAEILLVFDEVIGDAILDEFIDLGIAIPPRHIEMEGAFEHRLLHKPRFSGFVIREQDRHFVAEGDEFFA